MPRGQRRLAAIVAADVVGYSRLMGRDESGTLARLREHRKQRFEPTLARHGGRLVKLTGDGALAEFPSAVDVLGAAIEFQQAMADVNLGQPEDTAIVFRIGLHLGDLIVDGDDLYGDGVNVAARLEAEAPAGGIVISRTVHEAVAGRLKASFDDLGSLALKNIERPVQVFTVRWDPDDWKGKAPVPTAPLFIAAALSTDAPLALSAYLGDPEAGIERIERAVRLSPLDQFSYLAYGAMSFAHFVAGHYEDAMVWSQKAMRERPNFLVATRIFAASCAMAGRHDEAQAAMAHVRLTAAQRPQESSLVVQAFCDQAPRRSPKPCADAFP